MSRRWQARIAPVLAAAALLPALSGCGTLGSPMSDAAAHVPAARAVPGDPWERFNRAIFEFNDSVDRALLIPIARAYKTVVPDVLSQAFDNAFNNVSDAWSAINHALQGKPKQALDTSLRVGVNTTFGLAGLLDVATELGLERQSEDFGQTLGRWGFGPGPYLVLPLLGPSSVRDGLALPLDRVTSFSNVVGEGANRYSIAALELIHTRAGLLNASSILGQVALDRYTFVRDSYLARRRSAVYDGNPPPDPDDEEEDQAAAARLRK
ncbi:MAG: VacJ family lipoprotein [Rubrivivax sp.]|nr:VacJ family lipoprotein [Rubrivivax sp.]